MGTWKTKDGRVIRIVDLETNHLCNILRMFRRKAVVKYFRGIEITDIGKIIDNLKDPSYQITRSWRNYVLDGEKEEPLENWVFELDLDDE
jgi:hypothetical protein